ncbi:hypothetical protein LOK49_LG06G02966 [Camellia lanceoleosa]|uniref:Uncharacterized protein n=1 Tax=Camellia lanceoleosa TaxID=1840588 RepID=A0ACC0HEW2_9ERIC|nr:hypothetical protein LOK49_LG06G02966 [Camellia lanceoleosa]
MDVGIHVCYATEKIVEFEMQINEKDNVVAELRAEVERLRKTNEVQTLHLVGGFGSLMEAKDAEVKKLSNENAELRRAINVLEDQLADREVHNVTQAFRNVDVNPAGGNATPGRVVADAIGTPADFSHAVMWDGQAHAVAVYFTDVKSLVRQTEIRGNVIDAYAVLLNDEQERINEGVDAADKSYFFSKDLSRHDEEQQRKALSLKNIVSEVQRQTIGNEAIDTQDCDTPLESVADCPQQRPESLDCAILVCAVMRQYVRHVEVRRSLHGGNCSVLRAIMVKSFVNDEVRGLKNDVD